jgi:hypothetical protein
MSLSTAPTASEGAAAVGHATSMPPFCRHLSLTKIAVVVGAKGTLVESNVKKMVTACVYSGVPGNMSIETRTSMSSSQTHSLSEAESAAKAMFPTGLKISFASVSSFGPVAFSWRAVIGTPYSGLNVVKGSTSYFVEMGGSLRLNELEELERLAIAA